MHNKVIQTIALSGLFAATQMTMAMDSDLLSSTTTPTSTQPLSLQSGRRSQRSHSSPPSTLHLSISPIDDYDDTKYISPNNSQPGSQPNSPRKQAVNNPLPEKKSIPLSPKSNKKTLLNGFYAKHIEPHLPIHTYRGEKSLKNKGLSINASKITYENTITKKEETVRFSGKNNPDDEQSLEYHNERYHVIKDEHDNNMFAIEMHDGSSETKKSSRSQSPEKITAEQDPLYNGFYTDTLNRSTSNLPMYTYLNSGAASENVSMIIYTNKETNEDKTILFSSNREYEKERYIVIVDDQDKHIFTIDLKGDEATQSEETPQDTLRKQESAKKLRKLRAALSNSSGSDSERNKPQSSKEVCDSDAEEGKEKLTTEQQLSGCFFSDRLKVDNNDAILSVDPQSTQLSGFLTSMGSQRIPTDMKTYEGSITKTNLQGSEVTYIDENQIPHTICVNNCSTLGKPTFALITDKTNGSQFAIKLPAQEIKSTKSASHKQAFTPDSKKSQNSSNRTAAAFGTATFIAFCIALAYKYDKLPDTFAQLLDKIVAQCSNLIPNSFSR